MRKLDLNSIRNLAGGICEVAASVLLIAASNKVIEVITGGHVRVVARYSDAINAIMKSSMYSNDKREAAAVLKRYEDAEYYRAIINVVQDSRLYSSDKVELIKGLSEN